MNLPDRSRRREIQASQANYQGMELISPVLARAKTSVPHTWHAAEVFLYLLADAGD